MIVTYLHDEDDGDGDGDGDDEDVDDGDSSDASVAANTMRRYMVQTCIKSLS